MDIEPWWRYLVENHFSLSRLVEASANSADSALRSQEERLLTALANTADAMIAVEETFPILAVRPLPFQSQPGDRTHLGWGPGEALQEIEKAIGVQQRLLTLRLPDALSQPLPHGGLDTLQILEEVASALKRVVR